MVRLRARIGLLPAVVSTAALVKAKRLRRNALFFLGMFFAFWPFLALIAAAGPFERSAIVVAVIDPSEIEAADSFVVQFDDGVTIAFDEDPGVSIGQTVTVRGPQSDPDGIVLDGEFIPTDGYTDDGNEALVVMGVFALLTIGAGIGPTIWTVRAVRQIKSDLRSPSESRAGSYVGSWLWRGLIHRASTKPGALDQYQFSGVPVAVDDRDGLRWYAVPVWALTDLVRFENELRQADRQVVVHFHPETRAVTKLESAEGRHHVEFAPPVDVFDPEAGLAINFSGRARRRGFPDV